MYLYNGSYYTSYGEFIQAQSTVEDFHHFTNMIKYVEERPMRKRCKSGHFNQINIFQSIGKIYINDFNPEFENILPEVCEKMGLDTAKISVYHYYDKEPDFLALIELKYQENYPHINEDEVVSKLELLCTHVAQEE
jgi:hypothetical protein